jgi:hypothetical protein
MKFLEKISGLLTNAFILSMMASAVRALIKPMETIRRTFTLFCGSILLGMIAGIICHKANLLPVYTYGIVGASGCFAKELIEWGQTVAIDPIAYWQRIRGIAPNHQTDDASEKEDGK